MKFIEVFRLADTVVESVVDHHAIQHPIELLGVDPMGAFDLAVQPRGGWSYVDIADAAIKHVVVERRLELGPVVGLDALDPEGQHGQD